MANLHTAYKQLALEKARALMEEAGDQYNALVDQAMNHDTDNGPQRGAALDAYFHWQSVLNNLTSR